LAPIAEANDQETADDVPQEKAAEDLDLLSLRLRAVGQQIKLL
jgi:hypothetical protein